MRITLLFVFLLVLTPKVQSQEDSGLFDRLSAIENSGITFYNVDGIGFSKQTLKFDFNERGLKKSYRKYGMRVEDVTQSDPDLGYANYYVVNQQTLDNGLTVVSVNYFVENNSGKVDGYNFNYFGAQHVEFERMIIPILLNNQVPQRCFNALEINKINFAGRQLQLGSNCLWYDVNNVQCPYYGQMNWSVHSTQESANAAVEGQFLATEAKKGGAVVKQEEVAIIFEGESTIAKRVTYDLTGATSALASLSGGKSFTIYYVSQQVRGNYVSCVLSFWNNDSINPETGLPSLLEAVMSVPKE